MTNQDDIQTVKQWAKDDCELGITLGEADYNSFEDICTSSNILPTRELFNAYLDEVENCACGADMDECNEDLDESVELDCYRQHCKDQLKFHSDALERAKQANASEKVIAAIQRQVDSAQKELDDAMNMQDDTQESLKEECELDEDLTATLPANLINSLPIKVLPEIDVKNVIKDLPVTGPNQPPRFFKVGYASLLDRLVSKNKIKALGVSVRVLKCSEFTMYTGCDASKTSGVKRAADARIAANTPARQVNHVNTMVHSDEEGFVDKLGTTTTGALVLQGYLKNGTKPSVKYFISLDGADWAPTTKEDLMNYMQDSAFAPKQFDAGVRRVKLDGIYLIGKVGDSIMEGLEETLDEGISANELELVTRLGERCGINTLGDLQRAMKDYDQKDPLATVFQHFRNYATDPTPKGAKATNESVEDTCPNCGKNPCECGKDPDSFFDEDFDVVLEPRIEDETKPCKSADCQADEFSRDNTKNILFGLMQDEVEAAQAYDCAVKDLKSHPQDKDTAKVIDALEDISDEEEVHEGELAAAIKTIDPKNVDNMKKGFEEFEDNDGWFNSDFEDVDPEDDLKAAAEEVREELRGN